MASLLFTRVVDPLRQLRLIDVPARSFCQMGQISAHWHFVRKLSRLLAVAALASWLGFVALLLQYDASRPTVDDPNEGRIYALNNHSHVVFITAVEKFWLNALVGLGGVFFVSAVTLNFIQRKRMGSDVWTPDVL
jgi:hypothetical protein